MTQNWPLVALREVVQPVSRIETVDAAKEYRLLGVRLDGKGPFQREVVTGTQTAAKKLSRVEAGDFIYSRLFAWRGAFGVIPESLHGAYVSGEFPTFRAITARIDVRYLQYWFCLPKTLELVLQECSGSTPLTRNRFKEQFFLALRIPLPSLTEQRRIVARINGVATGLARARGLQEDTLSGLSTLLISMAHRADLDAAAKEQGGWHRTQLGKVLRLTQDAHVVRPDREYPNLGIYSFGKGLFHKPPINGVLTSAVRLHRVKTGQFIYSRLFAFEGAWS
jgi:type I restriction enzyme, S subunit